MIDRFEHSKEPEPCWWVAEEAIFVGVNIPYSNVGQESWSICCWIEWVEIHHCALSDEGGLVGYTFKPRI